MKKIKKKKRKFPFKKICIFWIFVIVISILCYALTAHGQTITYTRSTTSYSTSELVTYFSNKYQVSKEDMLKVMKCESGNRQSAVGDGGLARGIYQYHKKTWDSFSEDFGETLDRESSYDQVKLTAWAFSKGLQHHWTCSRITGII